MRAFVKKHIVTEIALLLAVVSMLFVPVSAAYLDYIDFKTLVCLLCVLAVVNALSDLGAFEKLARGIIRIFKTTRSCVVALVWITLIGAMFMTNDIALLTFLPLSYLVLDATDNRRLVPWTFIMQNAAAVLGGMILPFGNPHNLYLYSLFQIPTGQFILTMLPTFLTSVTLITVGCLTVKSEPLTIDGTLQSLDRPRAVGCMVLFAITLLFVLRAIPWTIGAPIVLIGLAALDRRAYLKVDYGLLLTFFGFFIFAGNMANIPEVRSFLVGLLDRNALLTEVLTCQVISNLPTTLLMAPFTTDWATLLVATDIAGMGTPIASLASLITLRTFMRRRPEDTGYYMRMFLAVGFGFLLVLYLVAALTL